MRTVLVTPGEVIPLGYQYDNEALQVVFPGNIIESITDEFPTTGTFSIWYRRPSDALGYPIGYPLVQHVGNTVTWLITEAELANPGSAQVQLRYIVDDVCVMSQIYAGNVNDSVDIGSEVPEPMEAWADAIIEAVENVHGIPSGGSSGQVLAKASNSDYDVEWVNQSGGGGGGSSPSPYTSNPAALGTASPGSSSNYSRGDHVHPKPTPANIGAIAAPSSPATGAFLVYNGSAWVAQTLSTWQGGNY